ncbi:MAG TPA: hypothetical protein VMT28_12735 [Terriglobales bacterium]|nr:hypothetical protein [Terriglobales bacterium]
MSLEIGNVSYAVIGKPSLPDFHVLHEFLTGCMGESPLDQLQRPFQRYHGREQQMKMLGHEHKRMQSVVPLPPVTIQHLQEEARPWLGPEQLSALPG